MSCGLQVGFDLFQTLNNAASFFSREGGVVIIIIIGYGISQSPLCGQRFPQIGRFSFPFYVPNP